MDRRKFLRAYVRTNKRGKITPGSLTLLNKQPRTPGFKEVTNPDVNSCVCVQSCTGNTFASTSTYRNSSIGEYGWGAYTNIDSQCNTYTLYLWQPGDYPTPPGDNSYADYSIIKRDKDGAHVWTKQLFTLSTTEMGSTFEGIYLLIDKNTDRLFVCGEVGVVALNSNGVVLWAKQIESSSFSAAGYSFDEFANWGISPDGNYLYAGGSYGASDIAPFYRLAFVCKISTANGNIVKDTEQFYYPVDGNYYLGYGIYGLKVDGTGNVFGETYSYAGGSLPTLSSHLFKWNADLNEVWKTRMSPAETPGNYTDDLSVDVFGNPILYFNAYATPEYAGDSIVKVDGNTGQLLWRGLLAPIEDPTNGWYLTDKRSDAQGNIYLGDSGGGTWEFVKVDPNGITREFQYNIANNVASNLGYYWYYTGTEGPNLDVGFYLRPFSARDFLSLSAAVELKLPLTPISGTYGDYTFTDSMANFTWTSAAMPSFGPPDDITFTTVNRLNTYFKPLEAYTTTIPNPFTLTLL